MGDVNTPRTTGNKAEIVGVASRSKRMIGIQNVKGIFFFVFFFFSETNNELESSNKEIEEKKSRIETLSTELEELKQQVETKVDERERLMRKRKLLNDECNSLQKKLHCCDSLLKVVPKVNLDNSNV